MTECLINWTRKGILSVEQERPSNTAVNAMFLALLSAFLFGIATPFSKWLLNDLSPFQLAGFLYWGAALAVLPSVINKSTFLAPKNLDSRNRFSLIGAVVFGGILGPILLLIGLTSADSTAVSLWLNLELVATALLGVLFFKEKLGKYSWLGIFTVSTASVLISFESGVSAHWAGILLLLACFCWGIDNHLTSQIDKLTPSQSTFWKGLVAGSINLSLGLMLDPFNSNAIPIVISLVLGALSYGLSIVLYIRASHGLGATKAQVIFSSSPFFGVLLSVFFLRENFTVGYAVASILFLIGIALQLLGGHSHKHKHSAVTHTHFHRHDDGHHTHQHDTPPPPLGHVHEHAHQELEHTHPHMPDIHHKHQH